MKKSVSDRDTEVRAENWESDIVPETSDIMQKAVRRQKIRSMNF